jgi:putative ABC transport system permease protein
MRLSAEQTVQDMKFALRGWRRTPGFAVTAVATLALGLGANTAIFSLVSGVLLRPLPFPHPQELAQLSVSNPTEPGLPPTFVTAGDLESWRGNATSLESASTYSPFSQNLQRVDVPEQVATVRADRSFFSTLGVPAMLGRTFGERDPANVAVASFGFWQRHLDSDPGAIGRAIILDGQPFEVVAVMPAGFQFPYRSTPPDLWTVWAPPSAANARMDAVIGRLQPGVGIERARREFSGLSGRLATGRYANVTLLSDVVAGPVRQSLLVLLGAVGFVLLIACSNVANLLLARAAARSREVAVRMALGAARGRLIRQFLTESVLLAFVGGLLGLVMGMWMNGLLASLAGSQIPRAWEIGIDWRVFTFLLLVCLLTGVGFGIAPALGASRLAIQDNLKSGERGSASRVRTIRRAIGEVSPTQAAFRVATLDRVVDESLASQRLYLWLLGGFAAMGTLLAGAGIYGVIAYVVSLRTREFGIRMALGADAGSMLRMVMGRGGALVGLGLTVGAVGALALTRFLKSVLYGVTATDVGTFGMVAVLLAAVALGACVLPARRAARTDPAVALRSE